MFGKIVIGVRTLLGAAFIFFGAAFFGKFLEAPPPPEGYPTNFMSALSGSNYLAVVKGLELIGGLLLLTAAFAPLGLVILIPVTVNIALYDFLTVGKPGLGLPLLAIEIFLVACYWSHFKGLVTPIGKKG